MPHPQLALALSKAPWALRQQILDYADRVNEQATSIFDEAELEMSQQTRSDFVFVAGLRKLRSLIHSQWWTLRSSLDLVERYEVSTVRLGNTDYSRRSAEYRALVRLRDDLDRLLVRLEVRHLVAASSLKEVATLLERQPGH